MSNNKPPFMGERVRLADVCELIMGQSPSSTSYNMEGDGLPFYQGNSDFGEICPTASIWCTNPKTKAEKGDILISVRAPIGAINIASQECCIGRGLAAIRPKTSNVSSDYLVHMLLANRKKLEGMGTGSTFKAIGKKVLSEYLIPIYGKTKQIKIGQQFTTILKCMKTKQQQLDKLDQLIKSQFVEMFGDSGRIVKLADVCSTYNGDRGKNYPSGKDRVNHGIPFINAGHLVDGRVSFAEMDYITKERYASLSGGKIQYGDILYCLRGSLGKCAVSDFDGGTIASSMMIIRPDTSQILSSFLYQVLNSPTIICQLEEKRNGSSQPNLSARSVSEYKIPVPPIFQQQKFAAFVAEVDKSRFVVQKQIENLQTLYDSLAQEYFG